MSSIDARGAIAKIERLRGALGPVLEGFIDAQMKEMQETAVKLVPRGTGTLADTLAGDDAIEKKTENGNLTWRFGFLTKKARDRAWYWRFVEFGTRGYNKGERRRAGVDRRGRFRTKKIKRDIPARPAQPFLRPAFILFRQAIRRIGLKAILPRALRQGAETGNSSFGAVISAVRRAQAD